MSKRRTDPRIAVFHHLPKCAGTSLVDIFGHYFRIVRDYRKPGSDEGAKGYTAPHNLAKLSKCDLLCGHFEYPGVHVFERYPGIKERPQDYFLFMFVREPLALKCSLLRYEALEVTIDRLLERPNYMASCIGIGSGNLEAVMSRYNFVGSVESLEDDLPVLLKLLGYPEPTRVIMPRLNRTDSATVHLPREHLERFRAANALDYLIYERAVAIH